MNAFSSTTQSQILEIKCRKRFRKTTISRFGKRCAQQYQHMLRSFYRKEIDTTTTKECAEKRRKLSNTFVVVVPSTVTIRCRWSVPVARALYLNASICIWVRTGMVWDWCFLRPDKMCECCLCSAALHSPHCSCTADSAWALVYSMMPDACNDAMHCATYSLLSSMPAKWVPSWCTSIFRWWLRSETLGRSSIYRGWFAKKRNPLIWSNALYSMAYRMICLQCVVDRSTAFHCSASMMTMTALKTSTAMSWPTMLVCVLCVGHRHVESILWWRQRKQLLDYYCLCCSPVLFCDASGWHSTYRLSLAAMSNRVIASDCDGRSWWMSSQRWQRTHFPRSRWNAHDPDHFRIPRQLISLKPMLDFSNMNRRWIPFSIFSDYFLSPANKFNFYPFEHFCTLQNLTSASNDWIVFFSFLIKWRSKKEINRFTFDADRWRRTNNDKIVTIVQHAVFNCSLHEMCVVFFHIRNKSGR